jgi:hypothetical protein
VRPRVTGAFVRSPPRAGLFGRSAGSTSVSSDALVACRVRRPSRDDVLTSGQARFRRPHVNATDFPEPERLPSTSALRRALSRVAVWMRARHRSRGFAAVDPASDASSHLHRSRDQVLDPLELSASSSLEGSRGRAPLVDFCNRCDPRARLRFVRASQDRATVARDTAFLPSLAPFGNGLELRMAASATARFCRSAWPERKPAEASRARGW